MALAVMVQDVSYEVWDLQKQFVELLQSPISKQQRLKTQDCQHHVFNENLLHNTTNRILHDLHNSTRFRTLVSEQRLRATAFLTIASILLVEKGDIVETGVFAGGSSAVVLKVLFEMNHCNRQYWAFDSFEGLPQWDKSMDGDVIRFKAGAFKASQRAFTRNLSKLQLYDPHRIKIVKGWFNETCKEAAVEKISFLRLDGDLFASTWDAIDALYDKVVPGGFIYVDDYGSFQGCRQAIDMFRTKKQIYEPLRFISEIAEPGIIMFEAVWWQKRYS